MVRNSRKKVDRAKLSLMEKAFEEVTLRDADLSSSEMDLARILATNGYLSAFEQEGKFEPKTESIGWAIQAGSKLADEIYHTMISFIIDLVSGGKSSLNASDPINWFDTNNKKEFQDICLYFLIHRLHIFKKVQKHDGGHAYQITPTAKEIPNDDTYLRKKFNITDPANEIPGNKSRIALILGIIVILLSLLGSLADPRALVISLLGLIIILLEKTKLFDNTKIISK